MDDLLAARSQMAMSLAFHIIFAAIGIAMPLLMIIAEWKWLRTKDEIYLTLAKRWAKGTAILFAVGAVSGTVLSFELGLLWPTFMGYAGAIIGMPFSLEGFAFFTEAIFLGIHLYGWDRVPRVAHWLSGVLVALSGMASGVFVVTANAWMNAPAGLFAPDTSSDQRVARVDAMSAVFMVVEARTYVTAMRMIAALLLCFVASVADAQVCAGAEPALSPSRDLYCIELVPSPGVRGAGRVLLGRRPHAFTIDVTRDGHVRYWPRVTIELSAKSFSKS